MTLAAHLAVDGRDTEQVIETWNHTIEVPCHIPGTHLAVCRRQPALGAAGAHPRDSAALEAPPSSVPYIDSETTEPPDANRIRPAPNSHRAQGGERASLSREIPARGPADARPEDGRRVRRAPKDSANICSAWKLDNPARPLEAALFAQALGEDETLFVQVALQDLINDAGVPAKVKVTRPDDVA